MIESIEISNYKTIEKISLKLGRTNVFIGENGSGKSNILEAVALAGAAQAGKLDNEFLTSRGIRVSRAELMRSAFDDGSASKPINISVKISDSGPRIKYRLTNDNEPYSNWHLATTAEGGTFDDFLASIRSHILNIKDDKEKAVFRKQVVDQLLKQPDLENYPNRNKKDQLNLNFFFDSDSPKTFINAGSIEDFIIYSPENSALRIFEKEGQIQPLGVNGEGLIKLLRVMSKNNEFGALDSIKDGLELFFWFKDFRLSRGRILDRIVVHDRFLHEKSKGFDQISANPGRMRRHV